MLLIYDCNVCFSCDIYQEAGKTIVRLSESSILRKRLADLDKIHA